MQKIAEKCPPEISISIVSHAQIHLVEELLHDIAQHCHNSSIEVILTLNTDEVLLFSSNSFLFPVNLIRNSKPKGFSANHNQAFNYAVGDYFCVMNPDIRLNQDPFPVLLDCLQADSSVGVVAPLVINRSGLIEDSARRFPTPLKILRKAFGRCKGSDYSIKDKPVFPDWVGGMFMLFPREKFKQLRGFDERFFLYYEDVDLCARLRLQAYNVVMCPDAKVIHNAQWSSHHNVTYLFWHLASMIRFFCSTVFMRIFCLYLKKHCSRTVGYKPH